MKRGRPGPEQTPLFTLADEFEPIDTVERDFVTAGGLSATLFVEAGAGSGKTSTLVARLVNLVCVEGLSVGSVAAITFTEAAAAELRDRVRSEFERRALEGHSVAVRRRCEDALRELDTSAISTLHSFAQRILSEHSIDAGVPPRFEVVDEVQSAMAFDQRWRDWLDVVLADPAHEELILRSRLLGLSFSSRGARSVKLIAREFDQNWDRLVRTESIALHPLALESLRPLAQQFLDEFHANSRVPDGMHQRLQKWLALASHIVTEQPNLRNLLIVDQLKKTKFGTPRKAAWVDVERMKTVAWAFREQVSARLDQARADVLRRWCELITDLTLASADTRRREGQLEFHDLLVLARQLVRNSAPAQRALHDRYIRILIDEFQDTDPLQLEVALRIAVGEHDGATPWFDLPVPPGRICVVGDPKQSIYRFRRADVAMFGRAREAFEGASTSVVLRQNFRTVRPIIEWVNDVFAQGFGSEWTEQQPAYQPLEAAREGAAGVDHRVVLLGGPADDLTAEARRESEAADVAAAVLATQRAPADWLVFDGKTGRWRQPAYSDVAILVPSRLSLPALQDALRDVGIPYRAEAATLVFDSAEVRDLVNVLRAIDDPSDEIAIVATLRSPLFGCGDDDLARHVAHAGRWDYRSTTGVPEGPVADALAYLRAKHDDRHWVEPSTLLDEVVRERHVCELALAMPRPREVWRRTRFFIEQARLYSEARRASLRGFLDWAERQRNEAARVHEPLLLEADDDSVRIMTIHGAKGLEFPIVFVSGLSAEHSRGPEGVSVRWTDGAPPEVKLSSLATPDFQRQDAFEQEMGHHERMRLLYVACTRARDHLGVSVHHKPVNDEKRRSHAQFLWGASPPTRSLSPSDGGAPPPRAAARSLFDDAPDVRAGFATGRAALLARSAEPTVVAATTIAKEARQDEAPQARSSLGRAGTAVGRAVHSVLLSADFSDPHGIGALAARTCRAEGLTDVSAVVRRVEAALAAPVIRAAAARRHWREMFVAAPLSGHKAVEGFVDLVVQTEHGLVIVDYKTDDISRATDVVDLYATQVAAYALALEYVSGSSVAHCVLLFVGPDAATEVVVEGDGLDAAKRRVLAAL